MALGGARVMNRSKIFFAALGLSVIIGLLAACGAPSDIPKIDPRLAKLSLGSIQSYRNIFRRDRDYSIMWFILAWGVNVVDATVSGHLKEFDVNNNLSLRLVPFIQPSQQQSGLSLQIKFKGSHAK